MCRMLDDKDLVGEAEGMHSDLCTKNKQRLWPCGEVPFVFNNNVETNSKDSMLEAMERISKVSNIKFKERKNEINYIEIIDKGCFASYVGMKGGQQELHVSKDESKWPHLIGYSIHELLHALGFFHEQCRFDRDTAVNVIAEAAENVNYKMQPESSTICYGPYDFESIMHYPLSSSMTLKQKTNAKIGQREKLSDGDINALNNLYPPISSDARMLINGTTDPLNTELSGVLSDPCTYPLELYTPLRQVVNVGTDSHALNKPDPPKGRKRTSTVDNEKRKRLKRGNSNTQKKK